MYHKKRKKKAKIALPDSYRMIQHKTKKNTDKIHGSNNRIQKNKKKNTIHKNITLRVKNL